MHLSFFYQTFSVEDTDIDCIRKEIEKTKQVIHDLNNLQHGVVKDPLLSILREVSHNYARSWAEGVSGRIHAHQCMMLHA